jgi:hypothetical protein
VLYKFRENLPTRWSESLCGLSSHKDFLTFSSLSEKFLMPPNE